MRNQDPLQGVTLKMVVTQLVDKLGWEALNQRISLNCFSKDPSISSSLKFLRKTPWAREKVEALYLSCDLSRQKEAISKAENIWLKKSPTEDK
jgi:uncharacterized protein (DUF2132 family)